MGNLNPYYNESFVFIVEQEQLRVTNFVEMVFLAKATTREHKEAVLHIVGSQNVMFFCNQCVVNLVVSVQQFVTVCFAWSTEEEEKNVNITTTSVWMCLSLFFVLIRLSFNKR